MRYFCDLTVSIDLLKPHCGSSLQSVEELQQHVLNRNSRDGVIPPHLESRATCNAQRRAVYKRVYTMTSQHCLGYAAEFNVLANYFIVHQPILMRIGLVD